MNHSMLYKISHIRGLIREKNKVTLEEKKHCNQKGENQMFNSKSRINNNNKDL